MSLTRTRSGTELKIQSPISNRRAWEATALLTAAYICSNIDRHVSSLLVELASKIGKHPIDAFLDLVIEEDLQTEFQTPDVPPDTESVRQLVLAPYAVPGLSDGGAHTKFVTSSTYGTEYIIDHVRSKGIVDLEEAHWRLSGYSAQAAGLKDRGVLRHGMPADIIIYDLDALKLLPIETSYDFPANEWRRTRKAEGYRFIMVNGEVTFIDGVCTGATPGHLLRHTATTAGHRRRSTLPQSEARARESRDANRPIRPTGQFRHPFAGSDLSICTHTFQTVSIQSLQKGAVCDIRCARRIGMLRSTLN